MLNQHELELYSRNILLDEIQEAGQLKLFQAKILVIGVGGLGSAVTQYLACAGIRNLGIIDNDIVELSNLQRQILHDHATIGRLKTDNAKNKLLQLNPKINLEIFNFRANYKNLLEVIKNYDLIIDATDNFPTRFAINSACYAQKKPLVFGAVQGFKGQLAIFSAYEANKPCYACFNPNIVDENFSLPLKEKAILGAVAGTIGAMQATYAIKYILNIEKDLTNNILLFDFLRNNMRKVKIQKNPNCQICKS